MEYQYPLTSDLLTMTSLLSSKATQVLKAEFGIALNEYRIIASVEHGLASSVSSLAKVLVIAPSRVSLYVSGLVEQGILDEAAGKGKAKVLSTTRKGVALFNRCRDAIWSTYQEMLSPLSSSQRDAFDIGCMATTTMNDGLHYSGQVPDRVYMCLRAFLLTELLVTETTKGQGLSYNEFRVLFALLQAGEALAPSELSLALLIPKSTITDLIRKLSDRGLVKVTNVDGRTKQLSLSETGRPVVAEAAIEADRCFVEGVRFTTQSERTQYVRSAEAIVGNARAASQERGGSV